MQEKVNPRLTSRTRARRTRLGALVVGVFVGICTLLQTGCVSVVAVFVKPTDVSWQTVPVGSQGNAQTVTLMNGGTSAVSIGSIAIGGANAGDFSVASKTCGSSLAAGSSCTATLLFVPTVDGARQASLVFTDGSGNSPATVSLSGAGMIPLGAATVNPSSLGFGTLPLGASGAAQTITLRNEGSAAISISSTSLGGADPADFTISSDTCGATLAASATCTVGVAFKPSAAGVRSATLTFTDNAANSPQTVALSGTGNLPNASVTPASLAFAANVGATSAPKSVTLSNGGTAAVNINSIAISGADAADFAIAANTCGTTLAGSGNCTVSIAFTPSAAGARTAALTFADSAGNSPQTVPLSGAGTQPGASVTPAGLTFTATIIGSTSAPQSVTLSNASSTILNISNILISGLDAADFAVSGKTCGASLAVSGNCTVSIAFTPSAAGARTATLTFTDSAGNSPQTATLSGTGGYPAATVMPASLTFASTTVGVTSAAQSVTLSNGASSAINLSGIAISGAADFTISNQTCGTTLAGSGNCSVTITFTPTAVGTRTATLTFTDTAVNSPQAVPLSGGGVAFSIEPANPNIVVNEMLQLSATAAATWSATCGIMNNPSTGLYTASSPQTCTITATETAALRKAATTQVTVVAATSGEFAVYPSSAAVAVGSQQVFQAQLAKAPDTNSLSYKVDGVSGGNSTTGTIDNQGLYVAPSVSGMHLVEVKDNSLGIIGTSAVTVYSDVTVDFGSRAANANPVPAGLFGAQYLESLHTAADLDLVKAGGITSDRGYAQIVNVFQTSTPNWNPIDNAIRKITAGGGIHVMLEMYQSPTWLQQPGPTCGVQSMPTDVNAWASIAQQYVQHMDATFPGIVTDYEIWNEPDIALCVPTGDSALTDYMKLYAAAVPLMKAQAKADGQTIRVGGPVSAGLNPTWITAMLNDPVISQNIDFMSYHNYLVGRPGETAAWDTYNGTQSIYQITQDNLGPANVYEYAGTLVSAGKQPQGRNLPIYLTEYNLDWLFIKTCCTDDFTYSPVWNALYVADLLDTPFAYNGAPNTMSRLIYYAASRPPYYCLIGVYDANMDCAYPAGATPQPYPQYFAYQLLGSPNYLGLQDGGYLPASLSPPRLVNGLVVAGFFTSSQDSIVLINPSQYTYTNMPINIANSGLASAQATLYQIVKGQSIQSSPLTLNAAGGTSYSTTVTMGPYSVQAIALH